MDRQAYIEMGLNGEYPLKVILCGAVEVHNNKQIGVVSLVYITDDKAKTTKS